MTDIDLLVLAAKALGRIPCAHGCTYSYCRDGILFKSGKDAGFWNPLTDDGDALRLAVKLGMVVHIDLNYCRCAEVEAENGVLVILDFEDGADKFAVTRRAITRAAAQIGEAMP